MRQSELSNVNEPYTNLGHSYTLYIPGLSLKSEHNLLTMNPLGSLLTIRVQTLKTQNVTVVRKFQFPFPSYTFTYCSIFSNS